MVSADDDRIEIWGGVECTVNRVGDGYIDQLALSGHAHRDADLERFAALGIEKIRYPLLWERTAPEGLAKGDWSWPDHRMTKLRKLGITPIVGLVHHGSGPSFTRLDDDSIITGLVDYAREVARRYPWVDHYCPVNEPLTTARFSGLYGHWYPHGRDVQTFARCLVNQCRAVAQAMSAIREINPAAKLVQTEDLAKIYSTPTLAYQADFENERRWVTFDLLTGTLTPDKPLWGFLRFAGISEESLRWFMENPCPPDIIGCNYYVVGERLLDNRLDIYPAQRRGGNGRHSYVDIEAVRVEGVELAGWEGLMREAWDRFHLPLAMTEVHLGCHREAQMRWFTDAWQSARKLGQEGIDVRAVTAWSLLGSYGWDSLATPDQGHYESGVFEVTHNRLRATALAGIVRKLAHGEEVDHPVLCHCPWWQRGDRFLYPRIGRVSNKAGSDALSRGAERSLGETSPLLIVGGRGRLGSAFVRACRERTLPHRVVSRPELDVHDAAAIERCISGIRPWAVINTTGYAGIDAAEQDAVNCYRTNVISAKNLAKTCARFDIQFVTFSTDLVFDGSQDRPYTEQDHVGPLCVYGHSKAAAERRVLRTYPQALVVRTSGLFGAYDARNYLSHSLRQIAAGEPVQAPADWTVSPTYLPDLVHRCLDLLIDGESGIWHITNDGACTWAELAATAARALGLDDRLVERCRGRDLGWLARRPRFSALASEQGIRLPSLDDALCRYRQAFERFNLARAKEDMIDGLAKAC